MFLNSFNVTDARGRKTRVPRPSPVSTSLIDTRTPVELARAKVWFTQMLHSREQRAIHWGLVVVSAVSSVTAAKVKGEPSFLIVGAFVTAIFLLAASLRAPSLRQVIRIIDEQMKFSEFPCIGCGYELRGLPAADDGATVCPECGAAWHVPVITPSSAAPSPPSS